ncbi:DNA recombination protein RmuC [Aliidiomarina quisquiliarum]|uniref:DNA recombination protein RmuC n=1 Tax=Aliidiomarina quisquiliarum TaxID=2938947 RepID=UPI00208F487D|nr:DNA recombination protein RmuC [Aliidiomarina quisquiliarum]
MNAEWLSTHLMELTGAAIASVIIMLLSLLLWRSSRRSSGYRDQVLQLHAELDKQQALAGAQRSHLEDKLTALQQSEVRLQHEFERLAQRIFEQKSQQIESLNQKHLASTLDPLKQQLEAFRQQVGKQHAEEGRQRMSLQKELFTLSELNKQMTAEAESLTRALKGDSRQQGVWGEVVLERILEQSGLREGHEYEVQGQRMAEEGKRYRPDVIIHLPEKRQVIIDSKVSLTAYERYFSAETDALRQKALMEHVASLKNHVRDLGKKNYQQLEGITTLDYVLLFVPIEPAFLLAVDKDPELIRLALDHNIMLVSPTNLLVALRTVHNIWQYEHQSQNAQRIASDAAKLYDKFVGFLDDLGKIEQSMAVTTKHFDAAMNKLSTGRGNLVARVEKFRELGVQPSKKINPQLLDEES